MRSLTSSTPRHLSAVTDADLKHQSWYCFSFSHNHRYHQPCSMPSGMALALPTISFGASSARQPCRRCILHYRYGSKRRLFSLSADQQGPSLEYVKVLVRNAHCSQIHFARTGLKFLPPEVAAMVSVYDIYRFRRAAILMRPTTFSIRMPSLYQGSRF